MKINIIIIFVFILIFFDNSKNVVGQTVDASVAEKECDEIVREGALLVDSFFIGDKEKFVFNGNGKWFLVMFNSLTFCFRGKVSSLSDPSICDSISMIVEINADFDTIICEPKRETTFPLTVRKDPNGIISIPELGKKFRNQINNTLNLNYYEFILIDGNIFSVFFEKEEKALKVRELLYKLKKSSRNQK